jgi:hypothetical protein
MESSSRPQSSIRGYLDWRAHSGKFLGKERDALVGIPEPDLEMIDLGAQPPALDPETCVLLPQLVRLPQQAFDARRRHSNRLYRATPEP